MNYEYWLDLIEWKEKQVVKNLAEFMVLSIEDLFTRNPHLFEVQIGNLKANRTITS